MTALSLLCALVVAGVLAWAAWPRKVVDDRVPSPVDRVASWRIRMGHELAAEELRKHRVAMAIDERATVQPKITPRIPK